MAGGHGGAREGAGRKPADHVPSQDKADFERERAEHERVKREQREFKLAQDRGEWVQRTAVQQASATAMSVLTQALRTIPDNCERQFALDPTVVDNIQRQVDAALAEASEAFRKMSRDA